LFDEKGFSGAPPVEGIGLQGSLLTPTVNCEPKKEGRRARRPTRVRDLNPEAYRIIKIVAGPTLVEEN